MRRGASRELRGFSIRYVAAFDSIQKLDGAGRDALRTGQVIFAYQHDLSTGTHLLLKDVSGAAGGAHLLCGRYRACYGCRHP